MVGGAFPAAGVAARRWQRFEAALRLWLETPAGRFAVYCAEHDRVSSCEEATQVAGASA